MIAPGSVWAKEFSSVGKGLTRRKRSFIPKKIRASLAAFVLVDGGALSAPVWLPELSKYAVIDRGLQAVGTDGRLPELSRKPPRSRLDLAGVGPKTPTFCFPRPFKMRSLFVRSLGVC